MKVLGNNLIKIIQETLKSEYLNKNDINLIWFVAQN